MTKPVVSVIIPYYKGKEWIEESINSVKSQIYSPINIIVVDDSPEVNDSLDSISDIQVIRHDENKGIAETRNTGITAACGKYIAILDQDDVWKPEKIEKQVNFLENNPNTGAVLTNIEHIDQNGGVIKFRELPTNFNKYSRSDKAECIVNPNSKYSLPYTSSMERRQVYEEIGMFDEDLYGMNDKDLFIRLLTEFDLAIIPEYLMKKRYHLKNASNNTIDLLEDQKILLEKSSTYYENISKRYEEFDTYTELSLSLTEIKAGNIMSGLWRFMLAASKNPKLTYNIVINNYNAALSR